jgi:putative DNA primase/helicase
MYSQGRYVCLTGKSFQPFEPISKQAEIDTLYSWLVAKRNKGKQERKELPQGDYSCFMNASEIIDKASASKGGDIFSELYAGRWEHLSIGDCSQSSADLAFCNRLAFWCQCDRGMMADIFKSSGLYRTERKMNMAIDRAIKDCGQVYKAGR